MAAKEPHFMGSLNPSDDKRLPLNGYFWLNLIVWLFMGVAFGVLGVMAGEWTGIGGFFAILAGSFTVASVFDYMVDRHKLGGPVSKSHGDTALSDCAKEEPVAEALSEASASRRRKRSKR